MTVPAAEKPNGTLRVLFLVENVPYSLDTRVRREAHVVKKLGGSACVICPSDGAGLFRQVDGVNVYQYWKPAWGEGFIAHLLEYVFSLCAHAILTAWVFVRHGFDVIHVANPPDILWLIAAPYKVLGKRFVFDHHDLVPELFQVRFADRMRWLHRAMLWLERRNIRLADHVISTNETFRGIAMTRGGRLGDEVTVVRNGPWLERDFAGIPYPPRPGPRARVRVGYLGIMNPQDRLDNLLEAARIVRHEWRREDIEFVLIGSGDAYRSLMALRDRIGLGDSVEMTGTLPWEKVIEILSDVDICVQPDPPTVFNRHLTMNKLMEYMAFGKAVVAYDMPETRVSGGDAVVYVKGDDAASLAAEIVALADDPERRHRLGAAARKRIEDALSWERQEGELEKVYRRLLPGRAPALGSRHLPE